MIKRRKTALAALALIALSYLLAGSEYISWWIYTLRAYFGDAAVDYIARGAGYTVQALGVLAFSLTLRRRAAFARSSLLFASLLVLGTAFSALAFFSESAAAAIAFGLLMNLIHGALGAYCLVRLAEAAPQHSFGIILGGGCALGCLGTWALSLPGLESFLSSPYVYIAYAALAALLILIEARRAPAESLDSAPLSLRPRDIGLAAAVIILLSSVKCIGFFFNSIDPLGDVVRVEDMRLFYAVGLAAAGLVSDRNRRRGAVCCMAALIFPVLAMILRTESIDHIGGTMWITGYLCLGFYVMFRTLAFTDLALRKRQPYLAPLGLMFGLIGDAAGTCVGAALNLSFPLIIIVALALLAVTIFAFFVYYNRTYGVLPQTENREALYKSFEREYALSSREADVFELVANGRSNSEIAADLYIAESTVKFHVKNILRKTACSNRTELMSRLDQGV